VAYVEASLWDLLGQATDRSGKSINGRCLANRNAYLSIECETGYHSIGRDQLDWTALGGDKG